MIKGLGGSIFIHNAIEYDYCIEAAIMSLLDICEQVVVLDAQSTDGTLGLLNTLSSRNPRLSICAGAVWECAKDYNRLPILANQAKNMLRLDCKWHFMLQADEVLHESSFPAIEKAISFSASDDITTAAYRVRRINVYGNFDLKLRYDSHRKPCGDNIIRLARREIVATGDAESLHCDCASYKYLDFIKIFHYGYMRKPQEVLKKGIDMTSWFGYGTCQKLVEMQNGEGWDPYGIIPRQELEPIGMSHPKYATAWVDERRQYYDKS